MVAFVVADEMYEKVENGDLVMEAKELDSIENNQIASKASVRHVCVFVWLRPKHQKTKSGQKVKGGMTRKVLPVAMFVFANLMIEMTMGKIIAKWTQHATLTLFLDAIASSSCFPSE